MSEPWYSVKCLFHHPDRVRDGKEFLFEERITLWKASSFEEAHQMAEAEAREYAKEANCEFVDSTDSFHLFEDEVSSGAEVYSLMRGSNLKPDDYRDTFCVTTRERLKPLEKGQNQPVLTRPTSRPV